MRNIFQHCSPPALYKVPFRKWYDARELPVEYCSDLVRRYVVEYVGKVQIFVRQSQLGGVELVGMLREGCQKGVELGNGVSHKGELLVDLNQMGILSNLRGYAFDISWIWSSDVEGGHSFTFGPQLLDISNPPECLVHHLPKEIFQ